MARVLFRESERNLQSLEQRLPSVLACGPRVSRRVVVALRATLGEPTRQPDGTAEPPTPPAGTSPRARERRAAQATGKEETSRVEAPSEAGQQATADRSRETSPPGATAATPTSAPAPIGNTSPSTSSSLPTASPHVLDQGEGPLLLFLHDFPLSAGQWDPQIDALKSTARVVAPDLPGFGLSPHLPPPTTIDGHVDWIVELARSRDLEPVVLVAHGFGAHIAMRAALRWPGLQALVLAGVSGAADSQEEAAERRRLATEIDAAGMEAAVDALLPKLLGSSTARMRPEIFDRVRAMMREARPEAAAAALRAMSDRTDAFVELDRLRIPVRWIVGAEDRIVLPNATLRSSELISHSPCEIVPRAGHLVNLEAPDAFTEAVRAMIPASVQLRAAGRR